VNSPEKPTMNEILRQSGFEWLTEKSDTETVYHFLAKFKNLSNGFDPAHVELVKGEIRKKLKGIGIPNSSDVLKKFFGSNGANGNQSRGLRLENPQPWTEPVDGAELLNEIKVAFNRFLVLPEKADTALSLWVLFAWAHDAFSISPLLDFRSPTKRCGKSTGLEILGRLVPRPLDTSNISAAAWYRAVEYYKPTLLVDEVDTFLKTNEQLGGIINAGHKRNSAFVIRCDGDDSEPKRFCVWGPKILAGIGRRRDTIEDRSVPIWMKRKGPGETVEKLRLNKAYNFEIIRRKAVRWASDNIKILEIADPEMPKGLNDRAEDNWLPLLAIADLAKGDWPKTAREAAVSLSGGEPDDDVNGIQLLSAIRDYYNENETDRVTSETLENYLHEIEDSPWAEYRNGRPISKTGISRLLKPFGVKPKTIRTDNRTAKGYLLEECNDAFLRYLPGSGTQSVTDVTMLKNRELEGFGNVTQEQLVTVNNPHKLFKNNNVTGVTDQNPVSGEKKDNRHLLYD
jgi:putative DNA primase/helicase